METDYLVVGGGATGMAFVDTLLDESDAHITIVDRGAKPGGHWNDAYPFVTLHQPSAFYGVNSAELGTLRKDETGPNSGLYEMAGGAEINRYYDTLMQERFLPSGRVRHLPRSEHRGDGRVVSLDAGTEETITVRRKTVDATLASPSIPATHKRNFAEATGVRVVPPNALPQLLESEKHPDAQFCILGGGKTGMDAATWLLRQGIPADRIQWVVPRDSWIQNRLHSQPGLEFFEHSIGGEAERLEAFAECASIEEVFLRLEERGPMLRIDPNHAPTMFHYATISTGEVALLRTITGVIRKGRVVAIEPGALVLEHGRAEMAPATLYIDCTASAIRRQAPLPVFDGDRISLQLLWAPLVTLSAAVTAYVEVHGGDEAGKNRLCVPVPFPHDLAGFARSTLVSMMNRANWSQDKGMRQWLRTARLEGFGKMVSEVDKSDAPRQAILARVRAASMPAVANMPKLMAAAR